MGMQEAHLRERESPLIMAKLGSTYVSVLWGRWDSFSMGSWLDKSWIICNLFIENVKAHYPEWVGISHVVSELNKFTNR